jgi:hypothetical protein
MARMYRHPPLAQPTPSQVAALCLLLTVLFTVLSTQLILPGGGNPLEKLRSTFAARERADYTVTVDRQIRPLRVPASARPE